MQYKAIVISAIAATVAAQGSTPDVVSLLSVLQTALPSTLVQEALTNSAAVASEIASEFAAGQTPSWFSALPTDIQTYLNPTDPAAASSVVSDLSASLTSLIANATAVAPGPINGTAIGNVTAVSASQSAILSSISAQNSSVLANATAAGSLSSGSMTASSTGGSSTGSSGSGAASATSAGSAGSSSSSSAGAAVPTALYGMGLAGAVGLVGVFAL